jgi:hypothetical protein
LAGRPPAHVGEAGLRKDLQEDECVQRIWDEPVKFGNERWLAGGSLLILPFHKQPTCHGADF